jgi:glutathione S-transferase
VRFALAYKGIAHERKTPVPGMHGATALRLTRGRHRRLPVLDLEGRRIGDSTAIIAALEEHTPDPPLYPSDAGERARALELEHFFDEQLAPHVRAFVFAGLFASDVEAGPVLAPGLPRVVQRALTIATPIAKPVVRLDYKAQAARVDDHRAAIRAAMDRLEAEIQPSGYLVGDRFSVADLAAATLFTPLLDLPGREHVPSLSAPVLELRAELSWTQW